MRSIRKIVPLIALLALAACGSTHYHPSAAQKEQGRADVKALAAKCIPSSGLAQLSLLHSLESRSGRQGLEARCGIPPARKAAFEAQVLSAAEHGHLASHAGRVTFFEITLPKIVEANQK